MVAYVALFWRMTVKINRKRGAHYKHLQLFEVLSHRPIWPSRFFIDDFPTKRWRWVSTNGVDKKNDDEDIWRDNEETLGMPRSSDVSTFVKCLSADHGPTGFFNATVSEFCSGKFASKVFRCGFCSRFTSARLPSICPLGPTKHPICYCNHDMAWVSLWQVS